jgi:hypothetical protein
METVWFASHRPTRAASASTAWAISALEQTGFVLGIRLTKVYPPAAAAAEPVEMSSLYSKPGVRQWQWVSMKAGRTVRPFASSTSSPSGTSSPRPTAAIFPSRSQTSMALSALSFALRISMVGTSLKIGNFVIAESVGANIVRPSTLRG